MDKIVGIDLGTSTSCLAAVVDGQPMVVPDGRGNRVTPSYIHVMEDGKILVGTQAKMEVISDPYSTIWATKRLIGRRYLDPRVQETKKHFGYDILPLPDGGVKVRGRDKELTPTEVAAIILKYMTRIGKKALKREIRKAVVTVPAYFTDPQRKSTREAGAMIGLDVVRLINEPTAAALAYGYDKDEEQTIAVFDLGGGTFDLSVLAIGQGVFEVLATDGDSYLGGEDFDNRLVDYLVKDFKKKYDINIYNDKMAHQRVKDSSERAKIALSKKKEVEINLPAICPDVNKWAGVEASITREFYEGLVEDLVTRTVDIFRKLLDDVSIPIEKIDNVVLVGGMTRMPLLRARVTEFFGRDPDDSVNPDEAVAVGAAIHAASLAGEKILKKRKETREDLEKTLPAPMAGAGRVVPAPVSGADVDMASGQDPDKTLPGYGAGRDRIVPGPDYDPGATMPGAPPPDSRDEEEIGDARVEADPDELMDAPEHAPEKKTRPADDGQSLLPMDKRDADSDLPLDPDKMQAGEEWSPEDSAEKEADDREAGLADFFVGATSSREVVEKTDLVESKEPDTSAPDFSMTETDDDQPIPMEAAEESADHDLPEEEIPEEAEDAYGSDLPAELDQVPPAEEESPDEEEDAFPPSPDADEEEIVGEPEDEIPAVTESPADLPADPDREPAPADGGDFDLGPPPEMESAEPELPADPDMLPEFAEEGEEEEEAEPPDLSPEMEMPVSAGPIIRDYETHEPAVASEDEFESEEDFEQPETDEPDAEPPPGEAAKEAVPETVEAPVLLDVLSQSVGIAHFGGHYIPIIKRFAKLPARASQVFTTCADNQRRIRITVLQGDGQYVKNNTSLGEFVLEGIEKAKRGMPAIEVTFDIDQNGLFTVSAKDQRTGAANEISLEYTGGTAPGEGDAGQILGSGP